MQILSASDRDNLVNLIHIHLENKDSAKIDRVLSSLYPVDVAFIVSRLEKENQQALFDILTSTEAAGVLDEMYTEEQVKVILNMSSQEASSIINKMSSDEAADILSKIPLHVSNEILNFMELKQAQDAKLLLSYPDNSAGSLMSTDCLAFYQSMTVQETIEQLKRSLLVYYPVISNEIYVINKQRILVGMLNYRDLLIKNSQLRILDTMVASIVSVHVFTNHRDVANIFRRYNLLSLPVVDAQNVFLGVITADDVTQLIHELGTEEMLKLEGIQIGQTRSMHWFSISKNRLHWLSINVVLNIFTASIIAFFESTLQSVIAIAVFLPIISDMSGCSGMQSVAVSICDLSLEKISSRDYRKVLFKELSVGLFNGMCIGLQLFCIVYFWKRDVKLGLIIASSLCINTVISVCVGGLAPLVLKKFNFDPTIASGPILTTITDMFGFLIVLALTYYFLI